METESSEERLVAVVSSADDVQQPIRTSGVRIVIYRDHAAFAVERERERIPESAGHTLELRAIRPYSNDVATIVKTGKLGAVGADPGVHTSDVRASADIHPPV